MFVGVIDLHEQPSFNWQTVVALPYSTQGKALAKNVSKSSVELANLFETLPSRLIRSVGGERLIG